MLEVLLGPGVKFVVLSALLRSEDHLDRLLVLGGQLKDLPARNLLVLGVANHDRAQEGEGQKR